MNVDVKHLPNSKIELTVRLEPDEVKPHIEHVARELSHSHPIKGFRPGKAPKDVVEKHVGKERLAKDAIQRAVRVSYVEALIENNLETIGQPEVTVTEGDTDSPLVYTATASVVPSVELPENYTNISVEKNEVSVDAEEVEKALETLRRSRAQYATVSRPAQKGDRVEVDFTASIAGVPLEGGESKQHPLIIGEGHFMEGFEDELIGMSEGETKKFSLSAPTDSPQKAIAGKTVDFSVTMRVVQNVELPELDDTFAAAVGKFDSLAVLRESVEKGLHEEKAKKEHERFRLRILEALTKQVSIDVPQELIEQELKKMEEEFAASLQRMRIDKESYLAHLNKSMDELREGWKDQANKRVQSSLILRAISEREQITASDEEVEARISELMQGKSSDELEDVDIEGLKQYVRRLLTNEKTLDWLEKQVTQQS